jgi:hypothetical protein
MNIFDKSSLLTVELQKKISIWIESEGKESGNWKLAWKGSRDGFSAKQFHQLCDSKGESVTVIKSTSGHLFGGYSSISWESPTNGETKNAPNSFIYTLSNPHGIAPSKFPLRFPQAVRITKKHGPIFGARPYLGVGIWCDIIIRDNCNTAENSIFFPSSYLDTTTKGDKLFTGAKTFQVADIEVFTH